MIPHTLELAIGAVRELGRYDPQADYIYIRQDLPESVRSGSRGIGDLVLSDPEWGSTFIHEFVHHLQTTTTLSGLRLYHFRWMNSLNILSSLDEHLRSCLVRGGNVYHLLRRLQSEPERIPGRLRASFPLLYRFSQLFGESEFKHRQASEEFVPNGMVKATCRVVPRPFPGLPSCEIPIPVLRLDFSNGEAWEARLGAHLIREACAKAIEVAFRDTFFPEQRPSGTQLMAEEAHEPEGQVAVYYGPLYLFMSCVRDPRFRNLASFAIVCELALMYDPVIAEHARRGRERAATTKLPLSPEAEAFWRRDHGPGVAFLSLLTTLNRKGQEVPSFDPATDGEEMYEALARVGGISLCQSALDSAAEFVDSDEFLFGQSEWTIFFGRTREHFKRGLELRRRWRTKPLLSCVFLHNGERLLQTVSVPALIRYENTVTGPSSDPEEMTLLLFSELVSDVLTTGYAQCLLKRKYPWLCDRSRKCQQGSRHPLISKMPPIRYWCLYAKGLLVIRNWLGEEGDPQASSFAP